MTTMTTSDKHIRNIPDFLWRDLRVMAAVRGLSIRHAVIEALENWVANEMSREREQIHTAVYEKPS